MRLIPWLSHPLTPRHRRNQRCINDLINLLALPAIWSGGDPSQILRALLDVLLGMLQLELVYVRLRERLGEAPIEMLRVALPLVFQYPQRLIQ